MKAIWLYRPTCTHGLFFFEFGSGAEGITVSVDEKDAREDYCIIFATLGCCTIPRLQFTISMNRLGKIPM